MPQDFINSPSALNLWTRCPPYPSETNRQPSGAIANPDGMLKGNPWNEGDGASFSPSVRSASPPGVYSVAMWKSRSTSQTLSLGAM